MYKNNKAIATPGNTIPTSGTRIEGKYEAVIVKFWLKIFNIRYHKGKVFIKGDM